MSAPYGNEAAKAALLDDLAWFVERADRAFHLADRDPDVIQYRSEILSRGDRLKAAIDSIPTTEGPSAEEAERALDEVGAALAGGRQEIPDNLKRQVATVRARLRAARASHTPEEIERAWAMLGKIRSSLCLALGPPCSCWACEAAVPAIAAVIPPRPEPAAQDGER